MSRNRHGTHRHCDCGMRVSRIHVRTYTVRRPLLNRGVMIFSCPKILWTMLRGRRMQPMAMNGPAHAAKPAWHSAALQMGCHGCRYLPYRILPTQAPVPGPKSLALFKRGRRATLELERLSSFLNERDIAHGHELMVRCRGQSFRLDRDLPQHAVASLAHTGVHTDL
jgi:hypothetical protein